LPARQRRRVLPALHPNLGIGAAYRRRVEALIDEMNASLEYWLVAQWRKKTPVLAQDEAPLAGLRSVLRGLRKRWETKFDDAAPKFAEYFATDAAKRVNGQLAKILADSGMVVDFKFTKSMREAYGAVVAENVALIKSIASEHLTDVEGIVMRSVAQGRDLGSMAKELRERFDVPKKRAALIARDQNNKATSLLTRVRQQEAGINRAIWVHSGAGRHPRPDHVAFSAGRYTGRSGPGPEYDVTKGAYLEGKWTFPGYEINCRCVSRAIV